MIVRRYFKLILFRGISVNLAFFDWANLLCYLLIAFDWDRCDVAKEQIHALKMAELCESYQNESNKQRRAKKYSYIAKI